MTHTFLKIYYIKTHTYIFETGRDQNDLIPCPARLEKAFYRVSIYPTTMGKVWTSLNMTRPDRVSLSVRSGFRFHSVTN